MTTFLEILKTWGPLGAFVVAVIDGAGLPNPGGPDYLLMFLGWKSPSTAYLCAACAVAGSLAGTMVLYWLARKGGEKYLDRKARGPRAMRFRGWFDRYGLVTVFIPALVPIVPMPLKVFVLSAGALGVKPLPFAATVALARLPRYFGLAYVGRSLSEDPRAWIAAHKWDFALAAALLLVLSFALIKIAGHYRAARTVN